MDVHVALGLTVPMVIGIAFFGATMALGKAVTAAMESVGRQPEAMTKILIILATGCAFIEAVAIYALVYGFSLMNKL